MGVELRRTFCIILRTLVWVHLIFFWVIIIRFYLLILEERERKVRGRSGSINSK